MTVIYVPRVFGGTLVLQVGPPVPSRVLHVAFSPPVQHLHLALKSPVQHMNVALKSPIQHLHLTLSEVAMTTPFTTIDSSATVTDQNGALVTNIPTATLAVTFQDSTSSNPTVTNMGAGVYTATYATKGPGALVELWSFTDTSGAVAQESRTLVIAY